MCASENTLIISHIAVSVLRYQSAMAAFHCQTWRTIVNVRFHRIDQIKLHNLETTNGSPDIKLNEEL